MKNKEDPALVFTEMMLAHHEVLLRGGDIETRDAVIVKMVALLALAFGIPPVEGQELDVDDCIAKLKHALTILSWREELINETTA
jgi:hypothetical protein